MKIVVFTRTDLINGVAYSPGEICGWPDAVADKLIAKDFARLYNDGKVQLAGGRIPGAKDWLDDPGLNDHKAQLKKDGKWPSVLDKPVVVSDPEVARAARERMAREMNQI